MSGANTVVLEDDVASSPYTVIDVLEGWDLCEPNPDLAKYSMSDIRRITRAIESLYSEIPDTEPGIAHLGATRSLRYAEGRDEVESIALHLLLNDKVWLPDPLFSMLSNRSYSVWRQLPESGSASFRNKKPIATKWTGLWEVQTSARPGYIRKYLPQILCRIFQLRELVGSGAVCFYPWELLIQDKMKLIRSATLEAADEPLLQKITQQYKQIQYNLGVRLGPMNLEAAKDIPEWNLKKGDPFWWVDKTPILTTAIINTIISNELCAVFIPDLPGDRVVYDYLQTGGELSPNVHKIKENIALPSFSRACWPDIVAIRKDSLVFNELRKIVSEMPTLQGDDSIKSIQDRLERSVDQIKKDTAAWRITKGFAASVSLALVTAAGTSLIGDKSAAAAAAAGVVTGSVSSLPAIFSGVVSRRRKKKAADLLLSISERMDTLNGNAGELAD